MIGKKIKQFRENAGMSQEALAEQMGVSRQAVSKWENGLSVPDMQNLLKLSQLFGVSMEVWTKEETDDVWGDEMSGVEDVWGDRMSEGGEDVWDDQMPRAGDRRTEPDTENKKKRTGRVALICVLVAGCCVIPIIIVLFLLVNTAGTQYHETQINMVEEVPAEEDYFVYDDTVTEEIQKAETEKAEYFATEQTDYLNSLESVALQETVFNFARAYFSADKQEAEKYTVIESENLEVWEKDVWEELDALNLKWRPEDLATEDIIRVQYEFRLSGEDSNTYLGLDVLLIQGEWKITDVYLEK